VSTDGKQKTVVRSGGGQTWADPTLLEWDPAHFRLFVGNLAGEVTDDSLLKAFSRYPSVQKARVVRDKRSTKSKGYGFVSFSDGEEYFQAAREMQGKYIGSHPVLLRRSTTEIRPVVPSDKKGGKHGKGGKGGGNSSALGAKLGAGVQKKKHSKTKGGLHVLG
jgi:RNA recognition motif-containing protein